MKILGDKLIAYQIFTGKSSFCTSAEYYSSVSSSKTGITINMTRYFFLGFLFEKERFYINVTNITFWILNKNNF